MQRRKVLSALAVLPFGFALTGAQASSHDRDMAEVLQAQGQVLPLQEVLAKVQQKYPGQVLKVEFEDDDDHCKKKDPDCEEIWVYEFKIMQAEGRLVKLKVDASSGEILKTKIRQVKKSRKRS